MTTDTWQVGASADDCYKRWNGSAWLFGTGSSFYGVGHYSSTYMQKGVGLRFTPITIPQGRTITSAYLVVCNEHTESGTVCRSTIKGEDVDSGSPFSDQTDFDNRPRTSEEVTWDEIPGWTAGTWYTSPDISSIIQEIVNREGWSSGNALVIFWDDFDDRSDHNAGATRDIYEYDQSTSLASKLEITWTTTSYQSQITKTLPRFTSYAVILKGD